MKREIFPVRDDWKTSCKNVGFDYFDLPSSDDSIYWSEGVAYSFTTKEIDSIEDATNELHDMCIDFVADTVKSGNYADYDFSQSTIELIETSWYCNDPTIYGRFDLSYDGQKIKMLEYNADTPTSLLEASVVQWDWLNSVKGINKNADQFNSIHEKLIDVWKSLRISDMMFVGSGSAGREDWGNIEYLMDTAVQAGIASRMMSIENVGWNSDTNQFVDLVNMPIKNMFKLYPWEWLVEEEFGKNLKNINAFEPAWKMLLSNKALLPLLYKKHKGHPNLLESHFYDKNVSYHGKFVKKPLLSREGANVTALIDGVDHKLTGSDFNPLYDESGYVIQEWVDLPNIDGFRPILGSWVIGDQAAGIGIREDYNVVTGNDSHFVPHYFL